MASRSSHFASSWWRMHTINRHHPQNNKIASIAHTIPCRTRTIAHHHAPSRTTLTRAHSVCIDSATLNRTTVPPQPSISPVQPALREPERARRRRDHSRYVLPCALVGDTVETATQRERGESHTISSPATRVSTTTYLQRDRYRFEPRYQIGRAHV